jgi:hypothetical protein
MQFLNPVDESIEIGYLADLARELIEFVAALEMGSFYSKRISDLIKRNYATYPATGVHDDGMAYTYAVEMETEEQYLEMIRDAYPKVVQLAVEMLRFQRW